LIDRKRRQGGQKRIRPLIAQFLRQPLTDGFIVLRITPQIATEHLPAIRRGHETTQA
jgi:hypothetical protein